MRRNVRKRPTEFQIARLAAAGRNDTEIGRLFDVSRDVIRRIRRNADIPGVTPSVSETEKAAKDEVRDSAAHREKMATHAEAMWAASGVDFSKDNLKFKSGPPAKLKRPEPSWPQRSSSIA
jgi:hypothetical protein